MFRATVVATLAVPMLAKESRQLIFGGERTESGKYPYYTEVEPDTEFLCGGTLVAPDMVLSHPQCEPLITQVKVGWYNQNDEDSMDILSFPADGALFRHPLYDNSTFSYGFLLIKLDGTSSKEIAHLNDDPSIPASDTPLSVVGRGNRKSSTGGNVQGLQNRLDEASLPFIGNETCELARSHGGWSYKDLIDDSLLCAGSSDYSICESDWGGPLVVTSSSSADVLVGVTSWSFSCSGETPAVFSRVSAGYDWLRYTICENSVQPPSYLDCSTATEPQFLPPAASKQPNQPIKFKWTFTPDDFNFDNSYTLERIDEFEVTKVDYLVPNAIPYGFSSTYERELTLEKGALYVWTISDGQADGLYLDSGGAELFLENEQGQYQRIHQEDESFSAGITHMFYAETDRSLIESPYYGANQFSNSSAFLKMTIEFDQYPWEIGWKLTTEAGDVVVYRPPRYYFNQVDRSTSEDFTVPEADTKYILTVVDTYGDGLLRSRTFYKITDPQDNVLVESQFPSGEKEENTFSYGYKEDPSAARGMALAATTLGCIFGLLFCL